MNPTIRALVIRCGDPEPSVAKVHGCFAAWFRQAIDPEIPLEVLDTRTDACDARRLDGVEAVVISGSPHSVYEDHPWIPALSAFVREAVVHRRMPVLGVCFGHQLLASALGGRVTRNPRGREMGTITVELNERGQQEALFEQLPARFTAHATHQDTVAEPPPGAVVFGRSSLDDCQAFRVHNAVGVQFHPEVTADMLRGYIAARAELLRREGKDPEQIHRGVADRVHGAQVLTNFMAQARWHHRATRRAV